MTGVRAARVFRSAAAIGVLCGAVSCTPPSDFGDGAFETRSDVPYGPHERHLLDIHAPSVTPEDTVPTPVLVFIHGGAWLRGDKSDGARLFRRFLERGWTVVSPEYRLGPGTAPEAVLDVLCAVSWLESSSLLGGERPLVLGGVSAGGHLALTAGALLSTGAGFCGEDQVRLRAAAVINWWGVTDLEGLHRRQRLGRVEEPFVSVWMGGDDRVDEVAPRYSPIRLVGSTSPPTFSVHATGDTIVPVSQTRTYHQALTALGVPNQLWTFPDSIHGSMPPDHFEDLFAFLEANDRIAPRQPPG